MPAGSPGRVEVFGEQAVRAGFIELRPRSQIIGFARQGEPGLRVYVARTDDVGLIWLERYRVLKVEERRWPFTRGSRDLEHVQIFDVER